MKMTEAHARKSTKRIVSPVNSRDVRAKTSHGLASESEAPCDDWAGPGANADDVMDEDGPMAAATEDVMDEDDPMTAEQAPATSSLVDSARPGYVPPWANAAAFVTDLAAIHRYARGAVWEVRHEPCHVRQLGELVAILEPTRGVKDELGRYCHQIWGVGRWAGCELLRDVLQCHSTFEYHLVSAAELRQRFAENKGDLWVWKLHGLSPSQGVEYVAREEGWATWVELPNQPSRVCSNPLACLGTHGEGATKELFAQCATSSWLFMFALAGLTSRGHRHKSQGQLRKAFKLLDLLSRLATAAPATAMLKREGVAIEVTLREGQICTTDQPGDSMSTQFLCKLDHELAATVEKLCTQHTWQGERPAPKSSATWLWALSELTNEPGWSTISTELLSVLSVGLDTWANRQTPASTNLMIHTHLRGKGKSCRATRPRCNERARHGNPGLRARLASKRAPRQRQAVWAEDGERGAAVGAETVERQICGFYSHALHGAMKLADVLEILLDASRFGSLEMEIAVAFSSSVGKPRVGIAGFLPPVVLRELGWRKEAAGAPLSDQNHAKLKKNGFVTHAGMKSYDYARVISHFLHCLGCSFEDFKAEEMTPLPPGWHRYWCPESRRWWRRRGGACITWGRRRT
jgi:hypothetical protein